MSIFCIYNFAMQLRNFFIISILNIQDDLYKIILRYRD